MSVLGEHPDAIINEKDLQIWNNAAFDNGADSESLNSNNLIKPPSWLFARLEAIRLEKQGKTVAPKFKEPLKNKDSGVKKIEQSGFPTTKIKRRGFSLGPGEIMSATNPRSKQSGQNYPQKFSLQDRKPDLVKLRVVSIQTYFGEGRPACTRTGPDTSRPVKIVDSKMLPNLE
ncbi:hypothetical protein L1887_34990 [Cichorium endivia]|nr:hypothetical protein L1887_34990 [Cichorium endivia]